MSEALTETKTQEYENMFTLMIGGFTLACKTLFLIRDLKFNLLFVKKDCFGAFFYRISGTIYQSSIGAAADLIGKSDEEIKSENFFNPCSIPNQVACFYKNFMSSFSDITSVFLLLVSTILVRILFFFFYFV